MGDQFPRWGVLAIRFLRFVWGKAARGIELVDRATINAWFAKGLIERVYLSLFAYHAHVFRGRAVSRLP